MNHAICRPSERITTLDVLGGLVLLGLLIDQAFSQKPQADLPVEFVVQLLVAGQFDRMGSFLFGLGVYRCYQQAGMAGLNANRIVRRLLIGLLGIGLILSLLLGSTDLLVPYTGLGFTLLYFRKQSVTGLLSWMVGIAGLAIGVPSFQGLLHIDWQSEWLLPGRSLSQGFSPLIAYELMMLGGLLIGKLEIGHRDPRLRVRLSLLQLGVLPVAFGLKGAWVVVALGLVALPRSLMGYQPELLTLCGFLGPLLLTGVYVVDVGLNARLTSSGCVSWLGRVGQMSLTNYVLQAILCPFLMYGYAVSNSGQLPFWGRAGIVVGIYALEISLSRLWRKYYQQGPLEWICRQWIYDKPGQSNSVTTTKL